MGSVYRKTVTKPVPPSAVIEARNGQRCARWISRRGKKRVAPLTVGRDGADRIVVQVATFTAKYRDGTGRVVEVATGCRDRTAAEAVLADLEKRADKVRSNMRTPAEDAVIDHQATPLSQHIEDYIRHQKARELNRDRIDSTRRRIERVASDCQFRRLSDVDGLGLERWLVARQLEDMSPGNRNEYRKAMVGFANWCVRNRRLLENPFVDVPVVDARADQRRKRRALTPDELEKLLGVARRRPLLDALTIRRGPRKGQPVARLSDERRRELDLLGMERALIYKTLVLTGLRRGELASLTVGQLELDLPAGDVAYAALAAADEKNRQGSDIPLRGDLAADLRHWLGVKLQTLQDAARASGGPIPVRLPPATPVFNVPDGLVRILNRDLLMAGLARRRDDGTIDKSDDRGRTIDVHALRHSFGTLLSKGGVAPRTAQAAMRHGSIDLTMNVYTDPRLLDVARALDALPPLPLDGGPQQEAATGTIDVTGDERGSQFAPAFAPKTDSRGANQSLADQTVDGPDTEDGARSVCASACSVTSKHPLSYPDSGCHEVERIGLEPTTPALQRQCSPN